MKCVRVEPEYGPVLEADGWTRGDDLVTYMRGPHSRIVTPPARPALIPEDIELACAMVDDTRPNAWWHKTILRAPRRPGQHLFLLDHAFLLGEEDGKTATVNLLGVHPEHRRKGLGRIFMECFFFFAYMNDCRWVRASTQRDNLPARALYESVGMGESHWLMTFRK